jgi:hypothetical protein
MECRVRSKIGRVEVDLGRPRYTKSQMVQAALAAGHTATERLLTDWQSAGLLDQPTKKGLGRGKGIQALWPESQLRLWLLLLDKRRETSQVPNLCNVTVGLWLYFGDDYATVRQVRKCMHTWSIRYGSSRGHTQAKQSARALLAGVPLQGSKNLRASLISTMATVLLHGVPSDDDRRRLHAQLSGCVVDTGQGKDAAAAAMVELVLIRLLASRHLTHDVVPDHILAWSRVWHLFGLRNFMAARQASLLPDIPSVDMGVPDFQRLIPNACRDLVSAVGMALSLSKNERLPAPFFHPDSWQDGWASVRVRWSVDASRILLPDGQQRPNIRIEVSGSVNCPGFDGDSIPWE